MALIGVLQTLVDGQIITAAQHNSNYGDIKTAFNTSAVLTDVAKVVTVTHTWSASQLFSGGATFGAALIMSPAASKLVPGVTSWSLRNNADNADNLIVADAGTAIFRDSVSIASVAGKFTAGGTSGAFVLGSSANGQFATSGGDTYIDYGGTLHFRQGAATEIMSLNATGVQLLLGAGTSLKFGQAVGRLIGGATSLSLRNNADNADNFLMTDAGDATMRGTLTFSTSVQPIKLINNAQIVWRNQANTQDQFGIGTDVTDFLRVGVDTDLAGVIIGFAGKKLSFYGPGGASGVVQPVIVGAKGGNVALANLMAALGAAGLNLVIDNTT